MHQDQLAGRDPRRVWRPEALRGNLLQALPGEPGGLSCCWANIGLPCRDTELRRTPAEQQLHRAAGPLLLGRLLTHGNTNINLHGSPKPQGLYFSGDGARRDEDGYYWITGAPAVPAVPAVLAVLR